MKKAFILFLIPICIQACSGGGSTMTVTKDTTTTVMAPKLTMPYTASLSSNFVPCSDSDVLVVLNSYKAWENGDMSALKATVADSTGMVLPSGYVFNNTADSFIKFAGKFRDSLSNVKIDMIAWLGSHSVDKNQDWVNVWYKETDTYKAGKVDSSNFEDANLVKDGKIAWTYSYREKLKP
jgi:ketosteroid isomerase-like protein